MTINLSLVVFGCALIAMGSMQFLVRDKWATSMLAIARASQLPIIRTLSERLLLRAGVALMTVFVVTGAVLIIVGLLS
ncbi:hypothetical protein IWX81_002441 [Salinibacterium sp. CAN_S4]